MIKAKELHVSAPIKSDLEKFERLQLRFENLGAFDSDSVAVLHMLIASAINRDPVDVDQPVDWDLYVSDEEAGDEDRIDPIALADAKLEMNAQAWKLYRAIQEHATEADVKELKRFCSRVDREEFEPRRGY